MIRAPITMGFRALLVLLDSIAIVHDWPSPPAAAQTSCSGALTGTWLITLDAPATDHCQLLDCDARCNCQARTVSRVVPPGAAYIFPGPPNPVCHAGSSAGAEFHSPDDAVTVTLSGTTEPGGRGGILDDRVDFTTSLRTTLSGGRGLATITGTGTVVSDFFPNFSGNVIGDGQWVNELYTHTSQCIPPNVPASRCTLSARLRVVVLGQSRRLDVVTDLDRVWANGHERADLTVRVTEASGEPVANRRVRLRPDPADGVRIEPSNGEAQTNAQGEATFLVRSKELGLVTFTATDIEYSTLTASLEIRFVQRRVVVFVQGIITELACGIRDGVSFS